MFRSSWSSLLVVGLGAVLAACGGGHDDSQSAGADLSSSAPATPSTTPPRDSVSCTVDGVTIDAEFQEVPNPCTAASLAGCLPAQVFVDGVPGVGAGVIRPGETGPDHGGDVEYEKTKVPNSDATHYVIKISDGGGQSAAIDLTSSGDEDDLTMTATVLDDSGVATTVTKSEPGGGVFCKVTPAGQ